MVMYRLDRPHKEGGGVCIYVSTKWSKYIGQVDAFSFVSADIEVLTINLVKPAFRKLLVSCVYSPPSGKNYICHNKIKDILNYSTAIGPDATMSTS